MNETNENETTKAELLSIPTAVLGERVDLLAAGRVIPVACVRIVGGSLSDDRRSHEIFADASGLRELAQMLVDIARELGG